MTRYRNAFAFRVASGNLQLFDRKDGLTIYNFFGTFQLSCVAWWTGA
jgi:hypothetical protein